MNQKNKIDILFIGHLCHDLHDGAHILGGTVSYASLMANQLEKKTAILTSVGKDFKFYKLFKKNKIKLINKPAKKTTVFENIYKNKTRHQYLHARSKTLYTPDISDRIKNTPIILFGPIANEIDFGLLNKFPHAIKAATIQGWLRKWNKKGRVDFTEMDWQQLNHLDIVFLSIDDIKSDKTILKKIKKRVPIVVMTKGAKGANVFFKNKKKKFPAFPVKEVDPTGAGDIFATSFLIKYAATKNIKKASAFAHAAASYVVENVGVFIPEKKVIIKRYQQYKRMMKFK